MLSKIILAQILNFVKSFYNMTKNEAQALIRKKMSDTEIDYYRALMRKDFDDCSYYKGIKEGLQQALQVFGMLDNEHNRLKSSL